MASFHLINPARFAPKRTGVAPPPDWPGCKCKTSECSTKNCRCHKYMYRCTSKCTCEGCDNIYGVRGSNPDTGFDLNELPSSNIKQEQASDTKGTIQPSPGIEPQQADTSSMISAQVTRQPQAPGAAASSSLKRKRTGVAPPPDYPGCNCKTSECSTKDCYCHEHEYGCTLKCTCRGCQNIFGAKGSDRDKGFDLNIEPEQAGDTGVSSNTEPGQGGISNAPDHL